MTLRERLEVYYAKHDPEKLDNDGITPICAWVDQHGEELLRERLEAKYGDPLPVEGEGVSEEAVEEEEERWKQVRDALVKFYAAQNVSDKTDEDLSTLMKWTKKRGLSSLQYQLNAKYGVALNPNDVPAWAALFEKAREANLEEEDITQLLLTFFQKHDPDKPAEDIEFLAGYAQRHGVDPVNEQLRLNFGLGLEDVAEGSAPAIPSKPGMDAFTSSRSQAEKPNVGAKASAPPTAPRQGRGMMSVRAAMPETDAPRQKRKQHLKPLLEKYYIKAAPDKLQLGNKDKFDKIVQYGVTKGLKKLNLALADKYGTDLDDLQRQDLRTSVAGFLNAQMGKTPAELDPWQRADGGENFTTNEDKMVNFALDNGMLALNDGLERTYGVDLDGREAI